MIRNSYNGIKFNNKVELKGNKVTKYRLSALMQLTSVVCNDNYELKLNVNGSEVSFLKKEIKYICFNKECSGFRGRSDDGNDCYHKQVANNYIWNNRYLLKRIPMPKIPTIDELREMV